MDAASLDALSAVLILWDLLVLLPLLLNLRGERILISLQGSKEDSKNSKSGLGPDDPTPQNFNTKKPPAMMRRLVNRFGLLGVLLHIAWSVDPTRRRGLYDMSVLIGIYIVQLQCGMLCLSAFFSSWIYALLKNWNRSPAQAKLYVNYIWISIYAITCLPCAALAIVAAFHWTYGCYVVLYIYCVISSITLIGMIVFSTIAAVKVAKFLKQRSEKDQDRRILVKKQSTVVFVWVSLLIVLLVIMGRDFLHFAVYSPDDIPIFNLIILPVVAALCWPVASYIGYVPWNFSPPEVTSEREPGSPKSKSNTRNAINSVRQKMISKYKSAPLSPTKPASPSGAAPASPISSGKEDHDEKAPSAFAAPTGSFPKPLDSQKSFSTKAPASHGSSGSSVSEVKSEAKSIASDYPMGLSVEIPGRKLAPSALPSLLQRKSKADGSQKRIQVVIPESEAVAHGIDIDKVTEGTSVEVDTLLRSTL